LVAWELVGSWLGSWAGGRELVGPFTATAEMPTANCRKLQKQRVALPAVGPYFARVAEFPISPISPVLLAFV